MDFSEALDLLRNGFKVARFGWSGKGMFLVVVPGTKAAKLTEGTPYADALGSNIVNIASHIDIRTAEGIMQPGWVASQADLLADDWYELGCADAADDYDFEPSDAHASALAEIEKIHKESGVTSDVTAAVHEVFKAALNEKK